MESSVAREMGKLKEIDVKSINEALSVLNNAARNSSDEVRSMLHKELKVVREALFEEFPETRSRLREIRDNSVESLLNARDRISDAAKKTASQVNQSAHDSPWYYIGGAALVATLLGFYFGKKTR